jgi:Zn ribbon nucleic-acid-binding protein
MAEPKKLVAGDPCPACGGKLEPAVIPTEEQYKKAFDRENPVAMQPGADTASPDVRAELGALHRCIRCGYQARFKEKAGSSTKDGAAGSGDGDDDAAAAGAGDRAGGKQTTRGSR